MSNYYLIIDDFEQLLLIDDEQEMDTRLLNDYPKIIKYFNNILQRLKKKYIPKGEINSFIYALKFIDNLNLFIDDMKIKEFSNLMEEINSILTSNNNINIEHNSRNYAIERIEYTKNTFINYLK